MKPASLLPLVLFLFSFIAIGAFVSTCEKNRAIFVINNDMESQIFEEQKENI